MPPSSMAVTTAGWVATSTTDTGGRSLALRPRASRTFSRVSRLEAYSGIVRPCWTRRSPDQLSCVGLVRA